VGSQAAVLGVGWTINWAAVVRRLKLGRTSMAASTPNEARSLGMPKLDIAALRAAADGVAPSVETV
jgi:hypothetical protein